jgi:anti-anti-sigma regulatory factor
VSFELVIAVKRDPSEALHAEREPSARGAFVSVALNGHFDEDASAALLSTISGLVAQDADSILIRMEDVTADSATCLDAFASALMSLRAEGVHVQISVAEPLLYAKMATSASSRDWLIDGASTDSDAPRRAIHLDGPADDQR